MSSFFKGLLSVGSNGFSVKNTFKSEVSLGENAADNYCHGIFATALYVIKST